MRDKFCDYRMLRRRDASGSAAAAVREERPIRRTCVCARAKSALAETAQRDSHVSRAFSLKPPAERILRSSEVN